MDHGMKLSLNKTINSTLKIQYNDNEINTNKK